MRLEGKQFIQRSSGQRIGNTPEQMAAMVATIPMGRAGTPLFQQYADFVTGATLVVDGGRLLT